MSDSFADLWSSSAPLPPKSKPQTLASASSSSIGVTSTLGNQPHRSTTGGSSKPDAFALLAGPGQSQLKPQQQRYGSPNPSFRVAGGRSNAGTPSPAPALPHSVTSSSGSRGTGFAAGSDAFSDLFSSSTQRGGDLNGKGQDMTIAARIAMESQTKASKGVRGDSQPLKADVGAQDTAWAGLDSLAGSGTDFSRYQTKNTNGSGNLDEEDDWGLDDFGSSATHTARSNGFAQPQPQQLPKGLSKGLKTGWDLDEFAPSASGSSSAQQSRPSSQPKSYSQSQQQKPTKKEHDVDFYSGNKEHDIPRRSEGVGLLDFDDDVGVSDSFSLGGGQNDGLLHGDDSRESRGDEDDILGMLGQPVETARAQAEAQKPPLLEHTISNEASYSEDHVRPVISSNKKLKSTITTPSSPPPHVLGQIVEMGFSVEQAKQALAKTTDGIDVQAALEMLLGGSEGSGSGEGRQAGGRRGAEEQQQEQPPARTRALPKGFKERERERLERLRRERERERDSSSPSGSGDVVSDVQEHADRLLSQASEIGLSVLSKASAFWKEGKERVVKVYEERSVVAAGTQKERLDGRPKWMTDVDRGSRDSGDAHTRYSEKTRNKQQQRLQPPQDRIVVEETDLNLFDDVPVDNRQPSVPPSGPSSVSAAAPRPATRDRPLPTASLSSLSTVHRHKDAGTSQFKLGQYAPAVESYTAAINSLPQNHLLLIPLLNNRALARMRIGECKGAGEDAGRVLGIVLVVDEEVGVVDGFDPNANGGVGVQVTSSSWHPSIEPPSLLTAAQQKSNESGWKHPQGLGVDLVEGYVKALRRRAEASEGRERWSEALKDWEVLSAGDGGWIKDQVKKEGQRGSTRCRKMMADIDTGSATTGGSSLATSKPRPKPSIVKPKPPASTPPSVALRSLQATTAQAEADENLKHQLKDTIDAKLAAWRTGKETNVRALLASLDMVLWEEVLKDVKLGGLHELVTPAQVKKGYVKAIAKVHPDKLNAQNSTVEQRMLANGVFGTLNEAWMAFQNS